MNADVSAEEKAAAIRHRHCGQRLAGYAELGITGHMPSAGLCRVKAKSAAAGH